MPAEGSPMLKSAMSGKIGRVAGSESGWFAQSFDVGLCASRCGGDTCPWRLSSVVGSLGRCLAPRKNVFLQQWRRRLCEPLRLVVAGYLSLQQGKLRLGFGRGRGLEALSREPWGALRPLVKLAWSLPFGKGPSWAWAAKLRKNKNFGVWPLGHVGKV
ncbi:unnamed protein product [Prunus armeniaca]